ncbi:hypothetical protein [Paenibacillus sp. YIM B09110]|uniref:hypothetical protein n=1 Tax=Paenibacillus sp. YIM B09110 TaxID=3126102 RepID=UPI00301BED71
MIKKLFLVVTIMILGIILLEGLRVIFNPLIRSEDSIREKLLTQIPLGTPMDEAIHFAKNKKGWSDIKISYTYGYPGNYSWETVGEKHISVYAGEYRSILNLYLFEVDVEIYFGFNENSELIDIRVRTTINSI